MSRGGEDYTEVNIIRKTVKEMGEYLFQIEVVMGI
jgi:hypothetical protein